MDKYNENKDIILQRKKERYHAKKQTAESLILLDEWLNLKKYYYFPIELSLLFYLICFLTFKYTEIKIKATVLSKYRY